MKRLLPHYQNYVRKCWQTLLCCALILLAGGKAQAQCNVSAAWTYTIHGDTVFLRSTDTSSINHHYWSFNGVINTSNQTSLIRIYPNYGTYHICQYVYTPGTNCTDSSCQNITLQATTPPCTISAAWTFGIHGDTVYFRATDTASATRHFWNFGDGSAITTGSIVTHIYAAAGTYHVCFYDYIPNTTCADSLCQNIVLTANPCHVSAAWTYTVHGDTVRLQSTDTSTLTHHYWSINGVVSNSTSTTLIQVFPNYGTYHICQYVEIPGAACSDSSCHNITLTAPCTLNASWTYNNQHGDTIRFTSADTSSTIHRYWTFGDGSATTSAVSPTHIYATPGTYHVCVRAYSSNNTTCADSFCSTITVGTQCRITAAWTETIHGDTVTFVGADTNSAAHHYWNFGDGTTGSGFDAIHIYANPGTYHVCFYVYLPGTACTDSFCNNITIGAGCHLSAAWTYTTHGDTVFLRATDTSTVNHHYWSFGAGVNGASGIVVTHVFPGSGTYHICQYVYTTTAGGCTDSSCNNIIVANTCAVSAVWQSYMRGDTAHFFAGGNTSGVYYNWTFGDGTTGTGSSPLHVYTLPGTYRVCLRAYTSSICVDSFCNTITVASGCHVTAAWSYTTHGDTVFLHSVDTLSANHHYWNVGSSSPNYLSGTNVTYVFPGSGIYHICLYVYTPGTTCTDSSCNNITVTSPCRVNAAWQSYTTGGDSVHFFAASQDTTVHYDWKFGDGNYGFGRVPVHVYALAGTYHVCLYAYTGSNCIDSFCNTITVGAGCHVSASWTYTTHGDSIFLHSVDTLSANHHYWVLNGNTSTAISGTSGTFVVTGPGSYHICLYVYTPGTTCFDSSCNNITIQNPCSVSAAWQSYTSGDTARFYAGTSPAGSASYTWNFGDGTTGTGSPVTHVYAQAGTYHVCLYAYAGPNCRDTFCNTITVNGGCHASAAWSYTTHGDTIFLTSVDTSSANHHFWNVGSSSPNYLSGTNVTYVFPGPGTYHICLIVYTPGTTCSDSSCNNVVIAGNCNITAAWQSYNRGDSVHFFASSNGTNGTYTWNFGDGTTGTGIYPIHVYANPGVYHVCLYTAITGTNCLDSFCNTITVNGGCHVSAAWTYTTHGDTVFLHSADTLSANHHYWTFGSPAVVVSGTSVIHVYTGPGIYNICLHVYTPGTTCVDSSCNNITITNPCRANAAWQSHLSGDTAHFYAISTDTTVHYDWNFGDGNYGFGRIPTHVYAQAGTYHVCLYAYTSSNCIDSFCNTITIGTGCHVTAAWTYTTHGDTVYLHSVDTLSANHHYWVFNGSTSTYVSGTSVMHVFPGTGVYHICLYVYTPGTTCSDSSCNNVTVTSSCTANAAWTSHDHGDTAFFAATDTSSALYLDWNFGDGSYGYGQYPTHVYAQPGTYHVCLYAYTSNTCIDSFCNTVTVGGGCHLSAAWTYTLHGDTVSLISADTSSANHHYWVFNGSTSNYVSGTSVTHIFPGPGTYHICLYVYTPGTNCSDSSCNTITITNPCNLTAAWQSYTAGDTTHFYSATNAAGAYYNWNFGDGSSGTGPNPSHVYYHSGTYHVCLYVYTNTYCIDSFCNTVTIGSGCHITAAWTYVAYGDSLHFTGADTNSTAHHYWSFGDGHTASGFDASHVYNAPGTYHVCYYVYIPGSSCIDSSCNTVVVSGTCGVTAALSYVNISHDTVAFYALFADSNANVVWLYGDGTSSSGSYSLHGYPVPGNYQVCLHVFIPGTPCMDSACIEINVGASCAVTAAWASITRANDSIQFYAADPDTNAVHRWTFGDGTTASGSYAAHTFPTAGTYHVCLYVSVPNTTCSDSVCKDVSSALGIDGIGGNYPTISLRPNPFSQYTILNIDGPASTYEVRIYDMLGQIVRTEVAVKNSIMIQRGNLSSGIYTYAVMTGNVLIGQGKMSIE